MFGVICGLETSEKIVEYGKSKLKFLEQYFGITTIPSKSTLNRILGMIDGEAVGEIIVLIMREMIGIVGDIVAIDGKTICSTKRSAHKKTLHILTAMATGNGVTLGQLCVDEKTNEIPCILELLEILDIRGKIVTADAMHAQKKTVEVIIEKEGDYCIGLKGNQETFHEDIKLYFDDVLTSKALSDKETYTTAYTSEKNRDRYEKRTCYLLNDISWLDCKDDWAGLKSVFAVRREVIRNDIKTDEMSYYFSSLETTPKRFLEIVREHWQIEVMHWMLDVVFDEDECRFMSENAQKSLNSLRKFALALHKNFKDKTNSKKAISQNMFACLLNDNLLLQILSTFVS